MEKNLIYKLCGCLLVVMLLLLVGERLGNPRTTREVTPSYFMIGQVPQNPANNFVVLEPDSAGRKFYYQCDQNGNIIAEVVTDQAIDDECQVIINEKIDIGEYTIDVETQELIQNEELVI